MTDFDFSAWMPLQLERVERALEAWVSTQGDEGADHHAPAALVDAMRYAVLDGGKRLRPLLVLASHAAVASATQVQGASS